MLSEYRVHSEIGGVEREHDAKGDKRSGEEKGDCEVVPPQEDEYVFGGVGDGEKSAEEVGDAEGSGGNRMNNGDISSYCSLGVKLTPSCSQVDTLKLVWKNANKKQSRKKFWANLKVVWVNPKRKVA